MNVFVAPYRHIKNLARMMGGDVSRMVGQDYGVYS